VTLDTTVAGHRSICCKVHFRNLRWAVELPALNEMFAGLSLPCIIGGNRAKMRAGRFSYWAAEPKEVLTLNGDCKDPFEKLHQALGKYRLVEGVRPIPGQSLFCGGWAGFFSYDLGRFIEQLPKTAEDDLKVPLVRLCFYDKVIGYDHLKRHFWLMALEIEGDDQSPGQKLASLENILAEAQYAEPGSLEPADFEKVDLASVRCNMDKDYYIETTKKIKRYIYDGEVYQINFSQRFECDYRARAVELFHWQNRYNPSGQAAYIDCGDFQIVSASPEMFITITDGYISTTPIKGTRPRLVRTGLTRRVNRKNFIELLHSEKEKAELNMIVDLERNDLARICEPGTRQVVQPRTIEVCPTVYQGVATIAGRLRRELSFCDVLKAVFPGGSITGAPKVRAMEIIEETEPTARGLYTGSIGYICLDGGVSLNIAIRTIIIKAGIAFVQTGGGIVADSQPEAEWAETLTKARALLAGIASVNNSRPTGAG